MYSTEEVLLAIGVAFVVSKYLLNTNRVLKAIELCKEHLFLLDHKTLKSKKQFVSLLKQLICGQMSVGYYLINDHRNAIECGTKLLLISQEIGQRALGGRATFLLAECYLCQCEYNKAKELSMKALSIAIEAGDKKMEVACYVSLGRIFLSLSEYVKAKEYHEKALAIAEKIGHRQTEATCYLNLGIIFQSFGENVKAKEYHEKALAIAEKIGHRETEAKCYVNLGRVFHLLGKYKKSKEYQQKALAIAANIGDRETEATCNVNLGKVFQFFGEYLKAKEYYEKALAIAEKIGDMKTEAICYGNLGSIFQSLGEYVEAKKYQEKALAIAEKIGYKEVQATWYGNLGSIFQSLGECVKAKEYREKALAIAEKIGCREIEAGCYGNLGSTFQSLGEYVKAKEYQEKALSIAEKIGDQKTEAICYVNLGSIFESLGEYVKAKEHQEKALSIAEKVGDRQTEVTCYVNLAMVFNSLGEHFKTKEYLEKALAIAQKIGYKEREAECCGNLGIIFHSLGEYVKAKEFEEKALAIAENIGCREAQACCCVNLGVMFQSRGEYVKAKQYQEKALAFAEEIGNRNTEAACCGNLGKVSHCLGERVKAKDYLERALVLCRETGEIERESLLHLLISYCMMEDNIPEAKSHFLACINKMEVIRRFLKDNDQFKISYFDKFGFHYRAISHFLCLTGNPQEGLYIEEIGRARVLADLMSAQYSIENEMSVNPEAWIGIERIMKKVSNCCLYISYCEEFINLTVVKADNPLLFRRINVNDCFFGKESVSRVADVFCSESYRKVHCLAPEQCEDRCWFPSNVHQECKRDSSQESRLTLSRLVEEDEDDQQPIFTLADGYKMIIAPVAADLLSDKPEIIIVPDRLFFKVPFAALKDERGKYLSESFRIRIVPSLTTLKLIHDSPADYHSQTGVLIVGDPDVGEVLYKGKPQRISRLPFASEEAEMVGELLNTQPLLGNQARKKTVLQSINSVSLIHFACHGDAERGEIVLAPPPVTDREPQEEDYLLTMADISQVRLRAKLVVLSCCHSAKGQIRTEGVVGIARAFLGSGARPVLVALWAIQDEATKQFMSRFYEHLVCGESASESLHQAMKWMRENGFSEVQQWAPFMLIGDSVTLDFQKLRAAGHEMQPCFR